MPTFYDSNGKSYVLTHEIGRGGEGTVFYCPNDLSLVAKIYHEPIDEEKAEKLRWMAANQNDGLLKIAAWIVDTLHNQSGEIVGFVMPNVKAKEIHELYSLKSRRVHFPDATWQFLLHTAANVARAFYVLHKNDHIMGDVNHGNCVVLADGTVKLIDCDSYSIKNDNLRYRCEVGVATHLAPELQGLDLSEVEREQKHDNFGLAVIIFQLLFLGRHPFSGNYLGAEDKSLEDCIRELRFAYGNQQVTNVKQPPGTLSLSQISPRLAGMFNAAFLTQNRPEPREWIEALEDLSNNLQQCAAHIGHYYFQELTACPWCEIEAKTGLVLFPFVSRENGEQGFNIFTIESLLGSLDVPRNLPAKPFKPNVLPPVSADALQLRNRERSRMMGLVALHFALVAIWTFLGGASSGMSLGIFLGFGFYFIHQKLSKDDKDRLQDELVEANGNWEKLKQDWRINKNQNLLDNDLTQIRQKIAEHQILQKERREQLANLQEESVQYHLRSYLSQYKLADLGLGKIQQDALTRYGLQTAADIEDKRLRPMLALDEETKTALLEWREELEKSFEAPSELPEVAKNRFEIEFTEKRRKVEREIEHLLSILRSGSTALKQQQQLMMTKAENIAQKLLQAESDLTAVGNNKQIVATLVLITLFVPTFGAAFRAIVAPVNQNSRDLSKLSSTPAPTKKVVAHSSSEYNFPVKENATNAEIIQMTAYDREQSAKTLHIQAIDLIEQKDFKKAEKKLRLAIKFTDYFVNIHYTMSNLLYDQGRYDEAIKSLEKALNIEPENHNAKLLLGASYIKINKTKIGEDIFLEVLTKSPDSYEANFNLGAISMKRGEYKTAKHYFETAIQTEPNSVEAIYEYGVCLTKLGDWQNAKEQYDFLARNDEKKAAQLWKVMNKNNPTEKMPIVENRNAPPSYAKQ